MKIKQWTSLPQMFFQQAKVGKNDPFLWKKTAGKYEPISWAESSDFVNSLACGLKKLGIINGDRVILLSENRPEWAIADLAIMLAGGITVPAYTTNLTSNHRHIINDSKAKAVILSNYELAEKLLPAAKDSKNIEFIITMDEIDLSLPELTVHSWNDVMNIGDAKENKISFDTSSIESNEVACLIYTSGTGGAPKGVMLSHRSIISNCNGARLIIEKLGIEKNIFLSFLPLSHSYEHTAGLFFPISIGAQIYYSEGLDKLAVNLVEVSPTIMVSVPRLYDVLRTKILQAMKKEGSLKKLLFNTTLRLGSRKYLDPDSLNLFDKLIDAILEKLVRKKIQKRFGGRLKAMVSGGAPLNSDVGLFFTALGVRLLQGYGQTEAGPVIACNHPDSLDLKTVGPALDGVSIKIAHDGEILVSGALVMNGYWADEKSTATAIRDNWLYTGDIGHLDSKGRLKITDRKKDVIVLSGGDNVSPQRVEGILTLQHEIGQAMVIGDKKSHLVALIVPDDDFITEWKKCFPSSKNIEDLREIPEFIVAIGNAVEAANLELSTIEHIRKHAIIMEPFTIDNELMTPTLKIRRHKVLAQYNKILENLY